MGQDLNSYATKSGGKKKHYKRKKRAKTAFGRWWQKRKKWQKTLMISAVALILAVIFMFSYILGLLGRIKYDDELDREDLGFTEPLDKDIYNIALFGIDSRDLNKFTGNSDSIMILSINSKTDKVKIISVMRDSLVPMEKSSGKTVYGKVNSAYASGGPQLAIKTLNQIFGLDISDYATVNFFGMSDIIDAVGGIDVELTKDEITKDYGLNTNINEQCFYMGIDPNTEFVNETGVQHLDGIQAVAYARIRHVANAQGVNNDYGRTDRQRLVMKLMFDKALDMPVTSYPSFVKKVLPYVKTSLSEGKILSLAGVLAKKPVFEETRIPLTQYVINGDYRPDGIGSTVYYNYEYAGRIIRAFIYEDMKQEDFIAANGIDKTEWYMKKSSSGGGTSAASGTTSGTGSESTVSSEIQSKSEEGNESSTVSGTESKLESGTASGTESGSESKIDDGGESKQETKPESKPESKQEAEE